MRWKNKLSKEQENRVAKVFKGDRTPASGAKWYCKGDVKCRDFLIEAKLTKQGQFKFTIGIWNKIRKEAITLSKTPLVCVELRGKGAIVRENFVIFNPNDFDEFLDVQLDNKFIIAKMVNMDIDFIRNNCPFSMTSKDFRFIMMKERDFLDELGLV